MFIAINKATPTTKETLTEHLLRTYSVYDLAETLASYMMKKMEEEKEKEPIALSQEEYDKVLSMFRVKGLRPDGRRETRGRQANIFNITDEEKVK